MFVPLVWYGLVEGKKLGFWSRLLDSTLTRVHMHMYDELFLSNFVLRPKKKKV